MEYVAAHGKQTLAASPLMGQLPSDLPSRLAEGKYRDTVYVRVSKDGLADDAFSDASCSRKLDDPYLESVVKSIRFKPALKQRSQARGGRRPAEPDLASQSRVAAYSRPTMAKPFQPTLLGIAGSLALGTLLAAADTPDTSKTHTLFMGADISVGTGKELYPVKDVVGSSWVVEVAVARKR